MKEATGETNMTIITVVLIGLITIIATPIVKNLITSTEKKACCVNNGGTYSGGTCLIGATVDENGKVSGGSALTLTDEMCK